MYFPPRALMGDPDESRGPYRPPPRHAQGIGPSHQSPPNEEMDCFVSEQLLPEGPVLAPRPARIPTVNRIVSDERVEVDPTVESGRVFGDEAAQCRVQVPGPIVIQLRL